MSTVSIYLVKKELDNRLLNKFDRLTNGFLGDGTHWGLEVRGRYYHLGVENSKLDSKGLYLDTSDLYDVAVDWEFCGKYSTRHRIGKTSMSHREIKQLGWDILSEWDDMNIGYKLLSWNCQRFAGFLLSAIVQTISVPVSDLPVELGVLLHTEQSRGFRDDWEELRRMSPSKILKFCWVRRDIYSHF